MQFNNTLRRLFTMRLTTRVSMSTNLPMRKTSIIWYKSRNCFFRPICGKNLETSLRHFSTTARVRNDRRDDDENKGEAEKFRYLKLMEFNELIWPNPFKTIKNFFMSVLIKGYFDSEFTVAGFLSGAEQAAVHVSALISRGEFGGLESLITKEAVIEIQKNYQELDLKQKEIIVISPADLFLRYIYEIGIIFDDSTNKRYVEITTVMQGIQGMGVHIEKGGHPSEMNKSQDQLYICNYRFVREYTKGVQSDWTINKLNHFLPSELVKRKGMFSR